jgi:IS30 family transposase
MQKKSYTHLSIEEREWIALGLAQEMSLREIARSLGRSVSTLSRELKRNGDGAEDVRYLATIADKRAMRRARIPRRPRKLACQARWDAVVSRLREQWSPEQIAADLRAQHPDQPEHHVSHETIYTALYILPRGELRRELISHLRQHRKHRRPRSRGNDRRGQIPNMVKIAERPDEVAGRQVPGHWEGDLIKGGGNASAVGTVVERHSRLVMLVKVDNASTQAVCKGFARKFKALPAVMRRSMTYDRGKEMAAHESLSAELDMRIFFADPHRPWQRGSNENTNGLLRQYLPKGTDLSTLSQRELNAIAHRLNTRPRKTLGWKTPLETYQQAERVALRT